MLSDFKFMKPKEKLFIYRIIYAKHLFSFVFIFLLNLLLFIIVTNYFLFPFNFIFYVIIKDINNFNIILKYE